MVTYFMPSHEMCPYNIQYEGYHGNFFYEMCSYSQYAIQRIPWYLILYHHIKSVLIIYNIKDTMVTYFIPSHEMCPYSQYAIQRIPW